MTIEEVVLHSGGRGRRRGSEERRGGALDFAFGLRFGMLIMIVTERDGVAYPIAWF